MNIKIAISLFCVLPFFLCAKASDTKAPPSAGGGEAIVLKGSDIVVPAIGDVLKETAKNENIKLVLDMKGTYPLLREDSPEDFDIAVVAVPKGMKLPGGLVAFPFAYQAAIVVVNASNPLDEISTDSLRRIYSNVGTNRIETWDQVGVRYAGLRNILPMVTSYSDGICTELFKYTCLDGEILGEWVAVMKDSSAVLSDVRVNNSAIGVVGKVYDRNTVKVLSVSDSKSGGNYRYAFPPNQTAIFNGDYPLTLSFYVVLKKDKAKKVKKLVNVLLGKAVANKLDMSGFFSAPSESRKKSLFELDIL